MTYVWLWTAGIGAGCFLLGVALERWRRSGRDEVDALAHCDRERDELKRELMRVTHQRDSIKRSYDRLRRQQERAKREVW